MLTQRKLTQFREAKIVAETLFAEVRKGLDERIKPDDDLRSRLEACVLFTDYHDEFAKRWEETADLYYEDAKAELWRETRHEKLLPPLCRTSRGRAINALTGRDLAQHDGYNDDPDHYVPYDGKGMMFEKIDGMYGLWDGRRQFYTRGRYGKKVKGGGIPIIKNDTSTVEEFLDKMPLGIELEGELGTLTGRRNQGHQKSDFTQTKFWVFDAPRLFMPFKQRWEFLQEVSFPHLLSYERTLTQRKTYPDVQEVGRQQDTPRAILWHRH